jgi:serine/threonine-protein kinase HipA
MTSEPTEAYVWIWLPGSTEPVVAGLLEASGSTVEFTYGWSYLSRPDAIALWPDELPLQAGRQRPLRGMNIAGVIADSGPDAWGRRVIEARQRSGAGTNFGLVTYLLESGTERIGALDFQSDPRHYELRWNEATLADMVTAAARLEAGDPLTVQLNEALLHGTSIGGARPKVLLDDGRRKLIAKLSSSADTYPVVKAEAVAMELARRVGLDVAPVEVVDSLGRDVLLVERFDRGEAGERRLLLSANTILGLDRAGADYGSYPALADVIRARFTDAKRTLRELFGRIVFNICVSNTDDHARNHAAFWDGRMLTLTPAYDICPQLRPAGPARQALEIAKTGYRTSRLAGCIEAAGDYLLSRAEAADLVDHQVQVIREEWAEAADTCRLTRGERDRLWERQFILNPDIFEPS